MYSIRHPESTIMRIVIPMAEFVFACASGASVQKLNISKGLSNASRHRQSINNVKYHISKYQDDYRESNIGERGVFATAPVFSYIPAYYST